MQSARKAALGLFFVSCILFLIFGSNRGKNRTQTIGDQIRSGNIGQLSAERRIYLAEVIKQVMLAANISPQVSINSGTELDGLHVYTVSSNVESLTGCGRGNAIYDASLDAIFIDENLVNPQDFLSLGEETDHSNSITVNDLISQKTYLIFILLHELGHRALHRNLQATFDTTKSASRARELEADEYAVTILERTLQQPNSLNSMLAAEKGPFRDAFSLATPRERAWLTIAQMVDQMSLQLMFSSTPISSLYQDFSHPSMIDRAESFLSTAFAEHECGVTVTIYLTLATRSIERVRSLMHYQTLELVLPERIYDVAFTKDGLLVGPENPTHLYWLSSRDIYDHATGNPPRVLVPATLAITGSGYPALGPADTRDYSYSYYLSTPYQGVFSIRPWQSWQANASFWKTSFAPADGQYGSAASAHPTAPQPTQRMVLQGDGTVTTLCDGHPCQKRLFADIVSKNDPDLKSGLDLNTVTEDTIYMTQSAANGEDYRRIYALDANSLSVKRRIDIQRQTCGGNSFETREPVSWSTLIAIPHGSSDQVLCFFIAANHDRWEAWDITTEPASKIATGELLTSGVDPELLEHASSLRGNFVGQAPELLWAGGSQILLNIDRDSVWLVDATGRGAQLLFHPGGFLTRMAVGHGKLAIFWRSGYKCYLVNLPKEK